MILNHLTFVDAVTQPTYTIKPRIRGIINLGNTCFLNSLIQSLHSTSFPEFVLEYCKKNNEDSKLPEDYNLSLSVNELFESICHYQFLIYTNPPPLDIVHFIRIFQSKLSNLILTTQQDPGEVFHYLVDSIEKENPQLSKTFLSPFYGKIINHTWCLKCHTETSSTAIPFLALDLDCPIVLPKKNPIKLKKLILSTYNTLHKVTDYKCENCSKNQISFTSTVFNYLIRSTSSKSTSSSSSSSSPSFKYIYNTSFLNFPLSYPQSTNNNNNSKNNNYNITTVTLQTIEEFPSSLCFIIQRNKYMNKISGPVDFPFSLTASDLVFTKEKIEKYKDINYILVAIIVHLGSSFSFGHYVTYRYEKHNQMWYYISDHHVTPISISLVKSAEPYLLFYERVK